jgi:HK97 family phage major capsid protein
LAEGGSPTESQQTLGQVGMRPHTIGAYTDLTRKFIMQSSIDAEMFVRTDLALRLALGIDLAGLTGSGAAGYPLGLLNTTGIGAKTLATANTPTHGELCDIEAEVAVDNALAGNLAYTSNATIAGKMKQTDVSTSTGRWVLEGNQTSNGYRFVMSNQVTAKYILFGNWTDMIMGMWSGVDVNVDSASLSTSGGIRIVVLQDVDVAIRHAESFAYGYKA